MSPRHFAKSYTDGRYKTHHYPETKEAKLEQKIESFLGYFWRKLCRKR